eukprot:4073610-Alexandrium_andersonii.AAC.1
MHDTAKEQQIQEVQSARLGKREPNFRSLPGCPFVDATDNPVLVCPNGPPVQACKQAARMHTPLATCTH